MKPLYFLTLFTLLGCAHKKKEKNLPELTLSKTEVGLKKVIDSFKLEYQPPRQVFYKTVPQIDTM